MRAHKYTVCYFTRRQIDVLCMSSQHMHIDVFCMSSQHMHIDVFCMSSQHMHVSESCHTNRYWSWLLCMASSQRIARRVSAFHVCDVTHSYLRHDSLPQLCHSHNFVTHTVGGLGSRPKKMYGEYWGDGVEYHLMSPTPRR